MAVGWTSVATDFAGRTAERAVLQHTLDAAAGGSPGLVVVRGEAGIGKTSLAAQACRSATAMQVLWGRCLQLDTLALPYLPFIGALDGWLGEAPADGREGLLEVAPGLRDLLPSLGATGVPGSDGVPTTLVRALDHCAAVGPTVLVVDDVQWADDASLDVLAYVVAGLRGQRLAILLTARSDQLADGDRLHGWLADIRRLPWVDELELRRMDADETSQQLAALLDRPPDAELVQEVLRRSEGNPYFTELLAREIDPATGQLPAELPAQLRAALLSTWHRLPQPARDVTRLLAVCGHPVEDDVLVAAAGTIGMGASATTEALHASADAGVVMLDHPRLWFRHPLLAEILLAGMLPFEQVAAHAALVEALTAAPREPRPADLARHYEGAHLFDQALEASLRAAERAALLEAREEEAELRLRAARLWPQASEQARAAAGSRSRLWADALMTMVWAGEPAAFEVAGEALVLLQDEGIQPGDTEHARLLRQWAVLSWSHGQGVDAQQVALDRALELCADRPEDPERAYVLAELSAVDLARNRVQDALARATEAVDAARRSGDPAAICWALSTRADALGVTTPAAEADINEALAIATAARLPHSEAFGRQAYAELLQGRGQLIDALEQLLLSRTVALDHGLGTIAQLSGASAVLLLCDQGRLAEAGSLLTGVLTGRSSGWGGIVAREAALRHSLRAGEGEDADANALRLAARAPHADRLTGLSVVATHAEYLVMRGRSDEALDLLCRTAPEHARASAAFGRELLVWAARAATDLAAETQRFDELLVGVGDLLPPPGQAVDKAWQAVLDAELGRLVRGREDPARWRAAAEALGSVGLGFEQTRSRLSLARCLFGTAERSEAATALREAHEQALAMGAVGLVAATGRLARSARISLTVPDVPQQRSDLLTRREREVLGHLVAGRTYAEIAHDLFISEKTVSVHVSNLLRKTGSANRVEAAGWAHRHGIGPSTP
jgi:DNA-binding CsgD family transcriptional regulator/tetratricopeptide (TPR) repeat protein